MNNITVYSTDGTTVTLAADGAKYDESVQRIVLVRQEGADIITVAILGDFFLLVSSNDEMAKNAV